jgi:hypothetical protein
MSIEKIQNALERMTRRWWFFVLFILLQFIPLYTAAGYAPRQIGHVIPAILRHSLIHAIPAWYPLFKIIPILLILGIIFRGNRVSRLFSFYAGLSYVIFAFGQNVAFTKEYGLGILTSNVVMVLLVALVWFWEIFAGRNDFSPVKVRPGQYWMILLAFIAFWFPADLTTLMPDFNPLGLFTNDAGLAFCLMTPVYLAVLMLYYPRINSVVLRVTALAGTFIGLYNMLMAFVFNPGGMWWFGVLHFPLLILSLYGLRLSFTRTTPH